MQQGSPSSVFKKARSLSAIPLATAISENSPTDRLPHSDFGEIADVGARGDLSMDDAVAVTIG